MSNITDIFGTMPMSRRDRKLKRQRYHKLKLRKQEASKIQEIYSKGNKQARKEYLNKMEGNRAFKYDLKKMKEILVKDEINVMKPPKDFFKSKTNLTIKPMKDKFKI